jgi:Alginate export
VIRLALIVFFILLPPGLARAQDAADTTTAAAYAGLATRVESWSFFEPVRGGGDPTYTFLGNRATLGARLTTPHFDLDGAFQYVQLIRLPENSIGPGALGNGALYYFSAGTREAYQLYFKTMTARLKGLLPGLSFSAGRMNYTSGAESSSGDPSIEAVKRLRLDARLIGNFEWSIVQRSFDGGRIDVDRERWSATAAVLFPTQGGYEESANLTITALRIRTAAVTLKPALVPHSDIQVFGYQYSDHRGILVRPDNSGRMSDAADINLTTIGASHVGVFPVRRGRLDTVLWAAAQAGDWYELSHRAFSIAAEAGYRVSTPAALWIRAGVQHASGDRDPRDGRHGTFFQMVPSIDRYSRSTTYAHMNLRDVFADVSLRPVPRLTIRGDVHRLVLPEAADRWYSGSGATARTGLYFGYSSRPSSGATDLGTIVEGSADLSLRRDWSVNGYFGWMKGGEVVRRLFTGERLRFFYLENVFSF